MRLGTANQDQGRDLNWEWARSGAGVRSINPLPRSYLASKIVHLPCALLGIVDVAIVVLLRRHMTI
jgi:hypothetical protein